MREVGGPEEAVVTVQLHQGWYGVLVGIARDPALASEIEAGLLAQRDGTAESRGGVAVHAIEPVADPPAAGFEQHDLQAREAVKDAELKQRREGVADGVGRGDVEKKVLHTVE